MQDNWEQNLAQQVKRKFENYFVKRIDLTVARADEEYNICGDFFCVIAASSAAVAAAVKFNRNTNPAIAVGLYKPIETVFEKFYLNNAIQTNAWLDVLTGINFTIRDETRESVGVVNPAIILTNAVANMDTPCAAHACKKVLIKAHNSNVGTVWVNFGMAAVVNACYDLTANGALVLFMNNTNMIHALFTVANDRLGIIYYV